MVPMETCTNCQKAFEGKYCPECGQEIGIKPTSFKFLFESVFKAFDLERGAVITFMHLFSKPGQVTDQLLGGNTRKYMNPIKYILIAVTVSLLFSISLGRPDGKEWRFYLMTVEIFLSVWLPNYFMNRSYTNFYGHLMIGFYQLGQLTFLFLIPKITKLYQDEGLNIIEV